MRYKNYYWILIILIFSSLAAQAQRYGNEWINYGQTYYKIPISEQGIYRISKAALVEAGVPIATITPRNLQLFHRGQEQAITVEGENDGVFNDNDYIEFYGKGNDGFQDKDLYKPVSMQPHNFKNLFSDTTAYFLTWAFAQQGKRMRQYGIVNPIAPVSHHLSESIIVLQKEYSKGRGYIENDSKVHTSWNNEGEGWTGKPFGKDSSNVYAFPLSRAALNTVAPRLEVIVAGRNGLRHRAEIAISFDNINFKSIDTISFVSYTTARVTNVLPLEALLKENLFVRISALGDENNPGAVEYISVSAVRFQYPQNFNLAGVSTRTINLTENASANNVFIQWQNMPANTFVYDITTQGNVRRIAVDAFQRSGVDSVNQGRKLFVSNTPIAITASKLRKTTFRNFNPSGHNYLIISNKLLMKPTLNSANPIRTYADYRASTAGGNYDTLVVEAELLFNQFAYGEYTPLAIRRFADFMLSGTRKPEYLLIIGKGRDLSTRFLPKNEPPTYNAENLIPPLGTPSSDIAYSFGLAGSLRAPAIATGRIAAKTPTDVMVYLDKVILHEQNDYDEFWRKNMIHVSGGTSPYEIINFGIIQNNYKKIVEGKYLGGKVKMINKTTSAIVTPINLADDMNKGVAMINIFGHASVSGPDMDIGKVSSVEQGFANVGKYPLVMANGCAIGDIFTESISLDEDWVLTDKKGAIGFLAHCDQGIVGILDKFNTIFYNKMFTDSLHFGESVGKVQQRTCDEMLLGAGFGSIYDTLQVFQMVLHGDPAIAVFGATKPDYKTTDSEVKLLTPNISAVTSEIEMSVIVSNYGKVIDKPMQIAVRRILANGTVKLYPPKDFKPVLSRDTIKLKIEDYSTDLTGLNVFEVLIDANDSIAELNENNNIGRVQYFVPQTGLDIVSPKKYSIVNSSPVTLVAQSTDLLIPEREYTFQIDTSATFNSSKLKQQNITAGNIVRWQVNSYSFTDSTVYFWRVRFANDTMWQNGSFIYIQNSVEGWSQSQFFQFSESIDLGISKNDTIRRWAMPVIKQKLEVTGIGGKLSNTGQRGIIKVNGLELTTSSEPDRLCSYGGNRLVGLTMNGNTFVPELFNYVGTQRYWEYSCGRQPSALNYYAHPSPLLFYFKYFMTNNSRRSHFVVLTSAGNIDYQSWSEELKDTLVQSYGVKRSQLDLLQKGYPFVLVTRRGAAPNSANIMMGDVNNPNPLDTQISYLDTLLKAQPAFGTITSTSIGPASSWGRLYFKMLAPDPSDKYTIQVLGTDATGKDSLLVASVPNSDYNLSSISAQMFPYLKLRAIIKDSINFTPPTLRKWQVIYNGVPEGTINTAYAKLSSYTIAEKQEGETFSLPFVFENLSRRDFADSLTVTYELKGQNPSNTISKRLRIVAPSSGDTVRFNLQNLPTIGFAGDNNLEVFVNPRILPEEKYSNNFLRIPFRVNPDKVNPVLDVAFDGVRIMDGDLVASSPLIVISLRDENKYRLLKDTANMIITLRRQCQTCLSERINFGQSGVRVYPATDAARNEFRVEFQPQPALADGLYTLEVRAKDIAANAVGRPYSINFEVVSKSSVTHFYPYPNPFSTSTRFVFTLTGSEIPEDIKVQIMTVSGKVVREIMRNELGNIRIGNNISTFAWDGTDEFGDKLANGVYLYRVMMQHNGQSIEHRETAADNNFKHGFGKMYIMR